MEEITTRTVASEVAESFTEDEGAAVALSNDSVIIDNTDDDVAPREAVARAKSIAQTFGKDVITGQPSNNHIKITVVGA